MGVLYLVSTPIGNREDITLRALRILTRVPIILCEDTRKTKNLLRFYLNKKRKNLLFETHMRVNLYIFSSKKFVSYYEENEEKRIPQVLAYLKEGKDVALVSSGGTPLISDPGFKLVRECIKEKIKIVPVPGASALLGALVASGLPTDKFLFLGYLPKKIAKKRKIFSSLNFSATIIFFESPHRLIKTLQVMKETFGDIEIVIARELTKIYEEFFRGKISQALRHFAKPQGEFVLLFNLKFSGADAPPAEEKE